MPFTEAELEAFKKTFQARMAALPRPRPVSPQPPASPYTVPSPIRGMKVYRADEPTPMDKDIGWVHYPQPDPAVANMQGFLLDQQRDEETPPSSPEVHKQPSNPGSGFSHTDRVFENLMAEMPVASSSPLSSPFSPSTHQEDYFGTQVATGKESQAEQSTITSKSSSLSRLASEEVLPSPTQGLPKLSPPNSPDQLPSRVRQTSKALKCKAESSSPAPKKRKVNTKGPDTGNSTSLRHDTVLKQEGVESEPKPLGQLARDIGHEVRKRSTRTTKNKAKKAATIKAKDNTAEDIKAENIKTENIKAENVKAEITTSHQAQPSLSETEDDAEDSDEFEDAVEYIHDSDSSDFPVMPSPLHKPGVFYGIQTLRRSTNGVTPRRISKKPEQRKHFKPQHRNPTPEAFPMIQESIDSSYNRGVRAMHTARFPSGGRTPMNLSKINTPKSAPDTSMPNPRMTRSRTSDDVKFMALDSDNTPTSVDNILLDLESIDRQHRMMMKMRKQAKARREGRVK